MAKTDPKQEKAFAAVLKKAKAAHNGEEADALEPIAELVFSFLTWNATTRQADTAFGKAMAQVVDLNELRVSHPNEIIELIGVRYPDAQRRVIRLLESMMEVFEREHDYRMTSIGSRGKREQREYLDTLPGIPQFVAARVALLAFGAHAMPVDDRLLALLVKAKVFEPDTTPTDAESWLTRQIKAGEAEEAYLALQAWADGQRVTIPTPTPTERVVNPNPSTTLKSSKLSKSASASKTMKKTKVTKKAAASKPAAPKAAAKKATTKKTVTKKSTKKKPATKKRVAKKK